MRTRTCFSTMLLILLIVLIFLAAGCSMLGLGMGAAIDKRNPRSYSGTPIVYNKLQSLKPEKIITIVKKDSTVIIGKYLGLETLSTNAYDHYFSVYRKALTDEYTLPAIGDSIVYFSWVEKRTINCRFSGFDYEALVIKNYNSDEQVKVELATIREMTDTFGNVTKSSTIRAIISRGRIPLISVAKIESANDAILIPVHEIEEVNVSTNRGKIIGLIIGILIDIPIIIWYNNQDLIKNEM
ncbi:MAG TPA: hypothetical protein PLP19_17040 [bacterium]|nr:hypothetical protein [bacterium]